MDKRPVAKIMLDRHRQLKIPVKNTQYRALKRAHKVSTLSKQIILGQQMIPNALIQRRSNHLGRAATWTADNRHNRESGQHAKQPTNDLLNKLLNFLVSSGRVI